MQENTGIRQLEVELNRFSSYSTSTPSYTISSFCPYSFPSAAVLIMTLEIPTALLRAPDCRSWSCEVKIARGDGRWRRAIWDVLVASFTGGWLQGSVVAEVRENSHPLDLHPYDDHSTVQQDSWLHSWNLFSPSVPAHELWFNLEQFIYPHIVTTLPHKGHFHYPVDNHNVCCILPRPSPRLQPMTHKHTGTG